MSSRGLTLLSHLIALSTLAFVLYGIALQQQRLAYHTKYLASREVVQENLPKNIYSKNCKYSYTALDEQVIRCFHKDRVIFIRVLEL